MDQQGVQLQQNNQPTAGGAGGGRGNGNGGRDGGNNLGKPDNLPPPPHQPCPRCNSWNTKFCYYNNYDALQLRYFCKTCKRNWTQGGALRNIPVGGNRKSNIPKPSMSLAASSSSAASFPPPSVGPMAYGGNSMLFGGTENGGAGFFLPDFASTIRGGMIQPPTGFTPNMMGLINLPRYPVPPQNSLNLFGVRETGGPSSSVGEPNLGVGPAPVAPPAPTGQFEETNNNNEENDETAKWFEFMKNN